LDVLVQLVIAAISTEPLAELGLLPESTRPASPCRSSARGLPKPFSVTGR
jgi:hypothetical protein